MLTGNIVCPDVATIGGRTREGHPPLNFDMDRCIYRLRVRAEGCARCPVGVSWAAKKLIWWKIWNEEKL